MATSTAARVVPSLMIPLASGRMLVPQAAVAEVIRPERLRQLSAEVPWLLGVFDWRTEQVPLISLEGMCRHARPPEEASRYVILYGVERIPGLSFYAIEAQGIPRSMKLEESMLRETDVVEFDCDVAASHVLADGQPAFLPDLSAIERGIRAELQRL
jgi:chemosensory pili system protein ChpC